MSLNEKPEPVQPDRTRAYRNDRPLHSVSAGAAVIDTKGRFLAIRRRDNGEWQLPGGVVELEEGPLDTVRREVLEETGVHVEPIRLTGVHKNMTLGVVSLVFLCHPVGDEPNRPKRRRRPRGSHSTRSRPACRKPFRSAYWTHSESPTPPSVHTMAHTCLGSIRCDRLLISDVRRTGSGLVSAPGRGRHGSGTPASSAADAGWRPLIGDRRHGLRFFVSRRWSFHQYP
ncbi:NUDIX hydrolase [Streptosporangium sp. NPDC049046]|uniref:NUDIX hydrolase n=1 Tax=Streptosporangium sp. NPDC049046 TaxID=3155031 RepID=UPI00341DBE76